MLEWGYLSRGAKDQFNFSMRHRSFLIIERIEILRLMFISTTFLVKPEEIISN